MKLYLVLYLLTREVTAVIQSVAWKEVLISTRLVSFTNTLSVSAVRAGNICDATENCVLVCAVESGYGLSEDEFESEYYETERDKKFKCWTKMTMKHTPVKLEHDGLYYHADSTRRNKMNGEHCIRACRRIPGYRSAIFRTDDQFYAIIEVYEVAYRNDRKYFLYTGLVKHEKEGTTINEWTDGTAYNLTVSIKGVFKYYILHFGILDDYTGDANCLCQGNPSLLDW